MILESNRIQKDIPIPLYYQLKELILSEIKNGNYQNIAGLCQSIKKDELDDYSLVPSKYIEFEKEENEIDYEREMKKARNELKELYIDEEKTRNNITELMKELGYEI